MASKAYDPYSFLGPYTQNPEEGLPYDLQNITRGFLDPYEWYGNLVQRLKETQDLNILGETPSDEVLSYIDTFIADGHIEAAASLLEYLLQYLLTKMSYFEISLDVLNDKRFRSYLEVFASRGLYEEIDRLMRHSGNLNSYLQNAARDNQPELIKYLLSRNVTDLDEAILGAAARRNYHIAEYLLFLRANDPRWVNDTSLINSRFRSMADMAHRQGYLDIANYFRSLKVENFVAQPNEVLYV